MSIQSLMLSNHFILWHPLLLLSFFPSIRVFSNKLAFRIRWPKDWSFRFSNNPSNEYWGLIFFRIDWFHLPAVQGTLESLLQHHNLKASVLWLSFLYGPTLTSMYDYWKNHSFGWIFVGKVMSLLFNMLSTLVTAFLPRNKYLLISWLQSLSSVILESKERKSITPSTFSPSFAMKRTGCHDLSF